MRRKMILNPIIVAKVYMLKHWRVFMALKIKLKPLSTNFAVEINYLNGANSSPRGRFVIISYQRVVATRVTKSNYVAQTVKC